MWESYYFALHENKKCAKPFAFELGTPVYYMQNYQIGKFLPPKK